MTENSLEKYGIGIEILEPMFKLYFANKGFKDLKLKGFSSSLLSKRINNEIHKLGVTYSSGEIELPTLTIGKIPANQNEDKVLMLGLENFPEFIDSYYIEKVGTFLMMEYAGSDFESVALSRHTKTKSIISSIIIDSLPEIHKKLTNTNFKEVPVKPLRRNYHISAMRRNFKSILRCAYKDMPRQDLDSTLDEIIENSEVILEGLTNGTLREEFLGIHRSNVHGDLHLGNIYLKRFNGEKIRRGDIKILDPDIKGMFVYPDIVDPIKSPPILIHDPFTGDEIRELLREYMERKFGTESESLFKKGGFEEDVLTTFYIWNYARSIRAASKSTITAKMYPNVYGSIMNYNPLYACYPTIYQLDARDALKRLLDSPNLSSRNIKSLSKLEQTLKNILPAFKEEKEIKTFFHKKNLEENNCRDYIKV